MDNKTWKEMTKLDKRNKIMIAFYILMVIFEIIMAIVEKEFVWIIVALLWGNIAVIEYKVRIYTVCNRRTDAYSHAL